MSCFYVSMSYEEYKELETKMRELNETVHVSTGGFYHKSIRLPVGGGNVMEFHGPIVKAAEPAPAPVSDSDGSIIKTQQTLPIRERNMDYGKDAFGERREEHDQ